MERLTFDGNFCDIAQCRELPCPYDNNCMQKQVWERLKSFEDTRLSPEGLKQAVEIEERLNECGSSIPRVAELIKADDDHLVVVLPFSDSDDVEIKRNGITYKSDHWNITLSAFAYNQPTPSGMKVGLFSVEEAEKALEAAHEVQKE